MKGYPNRYRIRIGDYRVGIEVSSRAFRNNARPPQMGVLSLFSLINKSDLASIQEFEGDRTLI
jgi:hypothetical protein